MNNDILVLILVVAAAIAASVHAWRQRGIPGLQAFPLVSLAIILWAVGQYFSAITTAAPEIRRLWLRLSLFGIDLLPVTWLAFVLLYTQGKQRLSWLSWAGLLALPILSQVAGNPVPRPAKLAPAIMLAGEVTDPLIAVQHSPWGWAHLLVGMLITSIGGVLLVLHLAHTPGMMRRRTRLVDVGAVAPMAFYLVESAGVRLQSGLFFTPLVFLAGQYAFLWGLRRGAHFQILPVARDLLLEKMESGVLVFDANGYLIDANPVAAALIGKPAPELLSLPLASLLPPLAELLEHSQKQDTLQTEVLFPTPSAPRWLDIRLVPLYNHNRELTGRMVEMQDVTRRRQAEDALRESEQRYRQVIEGMIEGVVVQDAQGVIIACNPSAEHILGLPMNEILGRTSTDSAWRAIHEDGTPFPGEHHPPMIALRTGLRQSHVIMGLPQSGDSLHWIMINSEPLLREGAGKPYAVVSTFVDITEDRLAAQTLRDSENRFRGLLEFAPVAIIITNDDGRIQLMNAYAEQLFGYERAELQGEVIEKLIPERFRNLHVPQRNDFVQQMRSRPMGHGQGLVALRKDGSEFLLDIGLNLIQTNQGTLVMSYLIDITHRKQAEEALHKVNQQLVHSLGELEYRNQELVTLTEMGDMLQICTSVQEAYAIVGSFAEKLFPDCSGSLYIANLERSWFEAVAGWGAPMTEEVPVSSDMCWALRRGRTHSAAISGGELDCQHVGHLAHHDYTNYICIPMQAQGEVIGLLHLRWKTLATQHHVVDRLAATVAEQITLSISNLMLRENLRSQSIRDPLTGVFNRRYMEEAFAHELYRAARHNFSISVIMLDIDHFKLVNDTFGHAYGDSLLKVLATYLNNRLRGEDILCRYGGEEFTIILPDTTLENAVRLAEKLRSEIEVIEPEMAIQPLEPIHISLGVAAYPEHGRNAEELLRSADWALYQAKQRGRDQVITAQDPT